MGFLMAESKDAFFEQMYTRVGQLTYVWGQLDHALAVMVFTIFHHHGNPPAHSEIPVSLKKRLEYIKRALQSFDLDDAVRKEFLGVLSRVKTESHTRNNLVHGAVVDYWIEKNELHAASLDNPKSGSRYVERIYSFDDIQAAADRVLDLTVIVMEVSQRLLADGLERKK